MQYNDHDGQSRPIVWFDSDCILCNRTVAFIGKRERDPCLLFGGLQSERTRHRAPAFWNHAIDTIIYQAKDGHCTHFSQPPLIRAHLKAPWTFLRLFRGLPSSFSDRCYRFIARNRHKFSSNPQCSENPALSQRTSKTMNIFSLNACNFGDSSASG